MDIKEYIVEQLKVLQKNGFILCGKKLIPYGVQLEFLNGALISFYHTGKFNVQGKHIERAKELLGLTTRRFNLIPSTVDQTTDCVALQEMPTARLSKKMLICHEQRDTALQNLSSRRIKNDNQ